MAQIHVAYHSILNLVYILKTPLPIEVICLGRGNDLDKAYLNHLAQIPNVTVTNINKYFNTKALQKIQGFNIKPFVILASKFREVIFFDADAVFFRDPIELYDVKGYKLTGTYYFHDRYYKQPSPKRWAFLSNMIGPLSVYSVQSDFITMDAKKKGYQELESGKINLLCFSLYSLNLRFTVRCPGCRQVEFCFLRFARLG